MFVQKGVGEDFVHVFYKVEGQSLQIAFLYLINIRAIIFADDDVGLASTLGCQDFFLDATYGQHLTAKGYLARHGHSLAHLALC